LVRSIIIFRKKGYFINAKEDIVSENNEEETLKRLFNELKGVNNVQKKAVLN
jgi:hypothetical protein